MGKKNSPTRYAWLWATVLLATSAWTLGCGGGGAGSVAPPPPPPSISVTITPSSGSVLLGETLSFSASVSNTTNTAVTWSVNGVNGGSSQAGTISANGVYTAPADLPPGGTVQVTATSQADSSKSATASVTITSDISVSLSINAANVELGATQSFQATIKSQGRPDPTIRWSLAGASCPSSCGSVDANGNYTAPQILPSSASVSLIATSVADPSKQATASITITSHFTLQLAAPTSIQAGAAATLVATLTPVPGSNPSQVLSWSLQRSGCTGSACGVLTTTTTQSAGGTAIADNAVYTAPITVPQPDNVLITVTPQADPSKAVQANITILQGASIIISPPTATLAVNNRITFTAAQGGTSSGSFNWSVNGVPGGNSTFGQICVTGSSPCQPVTTSSATQVDYVAPGAIPTPNPVSVTVSSAANPSLAASAQVTVLAHDVVSVLPNSVTLAPMAVQSFTATVLGTTNQNVTWQVQGTGCATAGSCGSVNFAGTYTAPSVAPTPNALQVVAISQDDPTQSGSANVTISSGPNILTFDTSSNTCNLAGNPIPLVPPSSGTSAVDICVFSEAGLDTSMTYTVSGPGDVAVISQQPAGLGIIHLTLQLPATAATGARTLFIQNTNLDRTAASAALDIQ